MKRSFADILQDLDGDRARKTARKLPEWAAAGAEIPGALALEQCSSAATAAYKAEFLRSAAAPARIGRILDLTGGMGVDTLAFSRIAGAVTYFERDAELAAAAERNFARLGAGNIEVRCETVRPDSSLPEAELIYADPARRDAAGRKVFLLEDCSPDVLGLLPLLLRKAPAVLLKLSPMADLAMLAERLGPALREIHAVESEGEVKELLCLLRREPAGEPEPQLSLVRLGSAVLRTTMREERTARAVFAAEIRPDDTLLEPAPVLLKAGAFNLPCARWGLLKLAPSTHFYLAPAAELPAEAAPFFKAHRIRAVLPFGAAAFRQIRQRWPRAEVTARDLPVGSAALQKKMGLSPGGDAHIFACRRADGSAVLLVTAI